MSGQLSFVAPVGVGSFVSAKSLIADAKKGSRKCKYEIGGRMRYRAEGHGHGEDGMTPAEEVFFDAADEAPVREQAELKREGGKYAASMDSNFYRVNPELIAVDSEENLRGFIKTRGSLIPGEEFVFWWVGDIYDMVDDQNARHMFSFEGFSIGRMVRVDGGWRMLTREVGLYKDPKTGEILDTWKNPDTGATNKCIHVWNDPVNQQFLLNGPRGNFKVPTTIQGDDIYWHAEIFLKYKSPLTRKEFPSQAQSDMYQSTEMFQFFCEKEDMASNKPSADCLISWVRVGQWLPWMEMGDRPGRLVYHCRGRKLKNGYADLSDTVRNYVQSEHPEYSSAPTNYTTPNETSWTYMKKLLQSKGAPRADGTAARPEPQPMEEGSPPAEKTATRNLAIAKRDLAEYDGRDLEKPIYLSLAGKIFDVSSAKRHYRKGETYNCLTGRDATYAFVSGDLTKDALDKATEADMQNLTRDQLQDLEKWVGFFAKTYPEVGTLLDY